MAIAFVMIVISWGYAGMGWGPAVTSIDFRSEQTCRAALKEMPTTAGNSGRITALCVPK